MKSQRQKAEDALQQEKQEWERTFNSVEDLIAILDCRHRIVRVNKAMAERLAQKPERCIGLKCYKSVHGTNRPPSFCPHVLTLADGKTHTAEVHERGLGGDFLVTTTPLRDESGQIVGAVHVARDITEEKKAKEALEEEKTALKFMLQASDHERRMIAYELHDGLAQHIAGAIMQFELFGTLKDKNPKQAAKAHETGLSLVRQSHAEVRHLINGVRTPILDEAGLKAAIAHLVHDHTVEGGPRIQFRSKVKFHRLSPELENAIYRIVQEGLTNACRHSKSKRVHVILSQCEEHVRVEIRDWGVGFVPNRVRKGRFGLEGIRQRARSLGGTTAIENAPGKGTRIVVDLPIVGSPK